MLLFAKTVPALTLTAKDIKFIRSLQLKKNRKEHQLFVVEGIKPVQELINSSIEVEAVYSTEIFDGIPQEATMIAQKELERISSFKTPNKVLALGKIPEGKSLNWTEPVMLFLDGINDPGNLGTIIRTAKWFGLNTVICSSDCADAFDRKVVQSTMGALFHTNVIYLDAENVLPDAKQHDYTVIGADMVGDSVYNMPITEKTLLVIGSEANGMRTLVKERLDRIISIPNFENNQTVESLNAGVATAIMLSQLKRPR